MVDVDAGCEEVLGARAFNAGCRVESMVKSMVKSMTSRYCVSHF